MHVAVHVIAAVTLLAALPRAGGAQDLALPPPAAPGLIGPVSAYPPTPPPPPEPPPDRWNFSAEASFTDQSGNKTLRLLTGAFKFAHREKSRFELDGSIQSRYGQSDGEVVARNYFSNINFSPFKQGRLSPSFSAKAERDPFKRLDLRFLGSAGAKYTPYRANQNRGELSLFLMTSYEFQDLRVNEGDDQDEYTHVPRWTMELRGNRRLNSSVTATVQSSYEPSWGELANYLLRSQTGLKVLLTEDLALSMEYQFNRTNHPPEGVAPDDRLFKTGIILDF